MVRKVNAVRTYRIVYTSGSSPKAHEFITDKPMVAQKQYEFLTSDIAKDLLKAKILYSGFDGGLSHEWMAYSPADVSGFRGRFYSNLLNYCTLLT